MAKEGKLRDEWVIKLSPCEVHSRAYRDSSLTSVQRFLGSGFGKCEFFDTCPIIRREAKADISAERQVQVLRKKMKLGHLSGEEREEVRKTFLAELKKVNISKGSLCVRRTAQEMALDIALVKMQSSGMHFAQAVTDAIVEFAQVNRDSSFSAFNGEKWIQVDGIDEVMGEIVQFALLIIGVNGSQP